MFGAVAAGVYASVHEAQGKMGSGFSATFQPNPEQAKVYEELYQNYLKLGKFVEDNLRAL